MTNMSIHLIRTLAFTALALAAFVASSAAQVTGSIEPQHPVLRAQATVTGDVVRIGDLIDNAGVVSNVAIFRAPDLGTTGSVSAAQVAEIVRAHAIVGFDTAGLAEVTVTRASRLVAATDIENLITGALTAQYPLGATQDLVLAFDQTLRGIQTDPTATGLPHVVALSFNARNGRFDVTVDLPGGSKRRLTGTATPTANVISVSRPLTRGEVFKAGDLVSERRPRADLTADMLTSEDQAIGLAARGGLSPGRPLRNSDLMKPEMIHRNENVTLVYEVPGITLTLRGKASDGGAEGDTIEVLNVQSKRMVQGVITGHGRVVVTAAMPSVVAEADAKPSTVSKAPARAQ